MLPFSASLVNLYSLYSFAAIVTTGVCVINVYIPALIKASLVAALFKYAIYALYGSPAFFC